MGITFVGGSNAQIIHNLVIPGGHGITIAGNAQTPVVEHNTIRARYADIRLTGTGASGMEIRANRLGGDFADGTGILARPCRPAATSAEIVSTQAGTGPVAIRRRSRD